MSDPYSRFKQTEQILVDGYETYGIWKQPKFLTTRPAENNIGVFLVTADVEGRPDEISNRVYRTPELAWILIAFNNVTESLNWPRAGTAIEYPFDSVVFPELL